MKKFVCNVLLVTVVSVLCLGLLTGCEKEVTSETEAQRVLYQTSSSLSDLLTTVKSLESPVKEEKLAELDKSLKLALETIKSTEDYCVSETVNKQYKKTVALYDKLVLQVTKLKGE